jgi:hypothetical protein
MKTANYPGSKLKDFIIGFFGFLIFNFLFFGILFLLITPKGIIFNLFIIIGVILNVYFALFFIKRNKKWITYGGIISLLALFILAIILASFRAPMF